MTSSDRSAGPSGNQVLDASDDQVDPTAAFELLSDETRVGIVAELARVDGVSFSTLRERVGASDSGRFNYHLERLRGRLVRKTDAGYELTDTGRAFARVLDGPDVQ